MMPIKEMIEINYDITKINNKYYSEYPELSKPNPIEDKNKSLSEEQIISNVKNILIML
jgi:hypothetical protein